MIDFGRMVDGGFPIAGAMADVLEEQPRGPLRLDRAPARAPAGAVTVGDAWSTERRIRSLTLGLVQRLLAYLQRARHDPSLGFEA